MQKLCLQLSSLAAKPGGGGAGSCGEYPGCTPGARFRGGRGEPAGFPGVLWVCWTGLPRAREAEGGCICHRLPLKSL